MLQLAAYLDPTQIDLICCPGRGSMTSNTKSVAFHKTCKNIFIASSP